uniref:Uncharacterized protein n=1 Tax=Ditylenchus dipsaci TaxID=166011 RepID=A0A915EQJ9_9BILA
MSNPLVSRCSIPDDQNVELQSLTPAVAKMSVDQSPALDKEVESPEESQPVFILTSIVILLFNQLLSLCCNLPWCTNKNTSARTCVLLTLVRINLEMSSYRGCTIMECPII